MNEERDFIEDVKVDRFNLDKENENQSSIYLYWSDKLTDQRTVVDKYQNTLNLVLAEKEIHYRQNPLDGIKVTEASLKSMVTKDSEIIALKNRVVEATKRQRTLQSVIASLEFKKSSLDNLTKLTISGYYSRPGSDRFSNEEDAQRKNLKRRDNHE